MKYTSLCEISSELRKYKKRKDYDTMYSTYMLECAKAYVGDSYDKFLRLKYEVLVYTQCSFTPRDFFSWISCFIAIYCLVTLNSGNLEIMVVLVFICLLFYVIFKSNSLKMNLAIFLNDNLDSILKPE